MLKITKKKPDFFDDLVKDKKNWDNLRGEEKKIIAEYLKKNEQKGMCAYCESKLKENSYHIEHFRKRSLFPELTFDYNNLFLSCNNENSCGKHKDRYGLTKDEFNTIYSPLYINLDEFEYSYTGEILGKTPKAKKTIEVFNLNERSLVEKRKKIIKSIEFCREYLNLDLFEIFQEFKTFLIFLKNSNFFETQN
ncbi:MAG: TIGR02646 family protein [Persephonella sp.]|nr:MAG: TIGR02646 family protein [Persephonella sp.]